MRSYDRIAPDMTRLAEPLAARSNAPSRATEFPCRSLEEVRRDIERVTREHPELSADGFGVGLVPPEEYERRFREAREAMLSEESCVGFERARAWLEQCRRTKNLNRRFTSYYLSDEARCWTRASYPHEEKWSLPHGLFIAAAIHLGFHFRKTNDSIFSPTVYLNLALPKLQRRLLVTLK
jgi:hypothetical protein